MEIPSIMTAVHIILNYLTIGIGSLAVASCLLWVGRLLLQMKADYVSYNQAIAQLKDHIHQLEKKEAVNTQKLDTMQTNINELKASLKELYEYMRGLRHDVVDNKSTAGMQEITALKEENLSLNKQLIAHLQQDNSQLKNKVIKKQSNAKNPKSHA